MDYRDVILGTPLGILGTILGPRPLFLLGPHSRSPDRTRLFPPVAHTETRQMQKAGRHTAEGKSIAHNPRPEKGFPWVCSDPCSKSLGPTGTETGTVMKHMQVQGAGQAHREYVSGDAGAPGEGLRQRKPWGGSAGHPPTGRCLVWGPAVLGRTWGSRRPMQVPWREGGQAPLSRTMVSGTHPRPQVHLSPSRAQPVTHPQKLWLGLSQMCFQ